MAETESLPTEIQQKVIGTLEYLRFAATDDLDVAVGHEELWTALAPYPEYRERFFRFLEDRKRFRVASSAMYEWCVWAASGH